MVAYYNEIDRNAAAWLRELIKGGHIADGVVDERSIEDVLPSDLDGFQQCHFFAGVGIWSYALRLAGWPDDRPVWTGSCPCQPFSQAGQGKGFTDKRHLWPAFHHLIRKCRPVTVFGEQVAGRNGAAWIELVHSDLEADSYAVGAVITPAAGFGAPHIRERLYWLAHPNSRGEYALLRQRPDNNAENLRSRVIDGLVPEVAERHEGEPCGVGNSDCQRSGRDSGVIDGAEFEGTSGHWSGAEWLACRDGKARPVEPGTVPVVNGAAARVVRVSGYGNGIVAPQAAEFIKAYMNL